jgi:nickel/cobalt transporter (NicO) family protein
LVYNSYTLHLFILGLWGESMVVKKTIINSVLETTCVLFFLLSPLICVGHSHVFIDFNPTLQIEDGALHGIDIVWIFDRFTSEMIIEDVDKNGNKNIDPDEMAIFDENYRTIEEANFFLDLYYGKRVFDDYDATLRRVYIENNQILYDIEIQFSNPLIPDNRNTLLVEFSDPEMFVAYTLKRTVEVENSNQDPAQIQFNSLPNRESCFAVEFIPDQTLPSSAQATQSQAVNLVPVVESSAFTSTHDPLVTRLRNSLFSIQGKYNRKLGDLVIDAKENFSTKIGLSLILLSFLYGILHALGPGHGKSVVVGYFLQQKASPFQVVFTASMISVIHTGSAVLLAFLFQTLLSSYTGFQRIRIQSSFSFIIACFILMVGLILFLQIIWKKNNPSATDLESNHTMRKWIYAAGFIPCPLSITIMMVSVSHNILLLGLLSVISISVGMMMVLTVAGLIAMVAKSTTYTYSSRRWGIASKLHDGVEFFGASLIILFGIGLILLYMPKF